MREGVNVNVELVRAIDLLEFCRRQESASFLHELVRRLVSADGARAEGFAPYEGLQAKGWDGSSFAADSSSGFVPAGHTNWELSATQTGLRAKADQDFLHRLPEALQDQSYVAVFLNRWKGKLAWAREKTDTSPWETVLAYDVDDMIAWLETHPHVHEWATRLIRGERTTIALSSPYEVPLLPAALTRRPTLEQAAFDAVDRGTVTAIWGGPGMGKSTLARILAHDLRGTFPNGVYYASPNSPDQERAETESLQRRVVTALNPLALTEDLQVDYRNAVAGKKILVLLDNASSEESVRTLAVEGVHCISTSRRRLSGLESAHHVEAGSMTTHEAAELLRQSADRSIEPHTGTADSVAGLCAHIPLALHLAGTLAALNPDWGLGGVERELLQRHGALDSLSVGDRAIRASFQTAVAALPEQAAEAFQSIAQIPGRIITAELLALASGKTETAARASLRVLREHALVTPADDIGLYRVHDLLYEYIEELALADPMPDAHANRIAVLNSFAVDSAEHAKSLARNPQVLRSTKVPADVDTALQWFDRFSESMFIGMMYVGERLEQHLPAYAGLSHLTLFLTREQRWAELARNARAARRWVIADFGESPSDETLRWYMVWLMQEIEAESRQRNHAKVEKLLLEARGLDTDDDDIKEQIETALGGLRVAQGRAREGLEHYHAAEALAAADPESPRHMMTLYNVGVGHFRLNQNEEALPYLERELAAVRKAGDHHGEGITLNTLGLVYGRLGRKDDARNALTLSVRALSSTPDRGELANALHDLASVLLEVGEQPKAFELFNQELTIREEHGDSVSMAVTRSTMLLNASEDLDHTEFLARAAILLDELRDDVYWQAALRTQCASVLFENGHKTDAQEEFRASLGLISQAHEEFPRLRLMAQLRDALAATGISDLTDDPDELNEAIQQLTQEAPSKS